MEIGKQILHNRNAVTSAGSGLHHSELAYASDWITEKK